MNTDLDTPTTFEADYHEARLDPNRELSEKRSKAKKAFDQTKEKIRKHGDEIAEKAREGAFDRADQAVGTASEKVRGVERAAMEAMDSLKETQPEFVVNGVRYFAERAGSVAEYFESNDSRAIASDMRQLVREHPGAVVGGLAVAGFFLGRFLKATTRDA